MYTGLVNAFQYDSSKQVINGYPRFAYEQCFNQNEAMRELIYIAENFLFCKSDKMMATKKSSCKYLLWVKTNIATKYIIHEPGTQTQLSVCIVYEKKMTMRKSVIPRATCEYFLEATALFN